MRDMTTTLLGNATADPQEKRHADGTATTSVRVAVNGRYFDTTKNEYADRKTEYVTVYTRRSLGRNVLESIRKGDAIIATGRLGSSEWMREDGRPEYTLTLQAEAVGPDLTYGTARYERARRRADPDVDAKTGHTIPPGSEVDEDGVMREESSPDHERGQAPADTPSEERELVGASSGGDGKGAGQNPPF